MTPLTVMMRCPKCGAFEETGYETYMRGNRPLCDYCGKSRMRTATKEELKELMDEDHQE